ncbi:flagellar protein FlaG [Metabacillus sp. YM-086]|uniref:flagellar protein FlaG n=1 Tax=Metabacillus sp. YM-086 TaxID=3341729 RepID=UPI003A86376D
MSVDKISSQSTLHIIDSLNKTVDKVKIEFNEETIQEQTPKKEEVEKVVQSMNDFIQPSSTHIKFELHEKLEEYYVTIVDNGTNEVIREIPSRKILDIYSAMTDFMGILFDKKI